MSREGRFWGGPSKFWGIRTPSPTTLSGYAHGTNTEVSHTIRFDVLHMSASELQAKCNRRHSQLCHTITVLLIMLCQYSYARRLVTNTVHQSLDSDTILWLPTAMSQINVLLIVKLFSVRYPVKANRSFKSFTP